MNTSDALILEFIDGTLDPAREQELFALMAAHPDMRETLRQHVNIGDAVRADRVAYAPPASLELGLFRSLGLSAPTTMVKHVSWKSGALASLGGLAMGVMATLLVLGTNLTGSHSETRAIEPTVAGLTTENAIAAAIPTISPGVEIIERSGAASPSIAQNVTAPTRVVERIRYIERPARTAPPATAPNSTTPAEARNVEQSSLAALHETAPQSVSITPVSATVSNSQVGPVEPVALARSTPLEDAASSRSHFMLELRRSFGGGDMTSVTTAHTQQNPFENTAAGAYYSITDSFAIGFEGGYERFAQVLRPTSGDTLMIEQRPAYLWGGAAVRYIPGAIPGTQIRPLFQGTLGATSAGPVVRGRLGATLEATEALGLNVGFDVGTLFYRYNGTTLASGRWGLTMGAEFKLP